MSDRSRSTAAYVAIPASTGRQRRAVPVTAAGDPVTARRPDRGHAAHLLRRTRPAAPAAIPEIATTHRIFGASILLSATRCLLSYIVLPILLPFLGLAKGVGPWLGIPIGVLALTSTCSASGGSGWPTTISGGCSRPSTPSWAPWC